MAKTTEKRESKKESKKVERVAVDEMLALMNIFEDANALERMTTNNDVAVEIYDTSRPASRCGLWQRSATKYDLYIGFDTPLYTLSEVRKHLTYVDDKKMSKKEIMFRFVGKDAWKRVSTFVKEIKAKETKAKEKETKELDAVSESAS